MKTCPECGHLFQPRNGRSGRKRCWDCWFKEYRRGHYVKEAARKAKHREKLCLHCHNHSANRPRGLCWHCYHLPGVREQYPSRSKFCGNKHGKDCCGGYALPEPTDALPGTAEKLVVLEERASRGQRLWHPQDATHKRETPAFLTLQGIEAEDASDE